MSLLLLLAVAMDGIFVAENPGSSLVFMYKTFQNAIRLLKRAGIKAGKIVVATSVVAQLGNCMIDKKNLPQTQLIRGVGACS